mmetsp:Transcript_18991/g.48596  ORF Transcript_18991/g.48596 Transcript_18991/m.48596 type:complete len:89 (+) Transcript_18991:40-306(+)
MASRRAFEALQEHFEPLCCDSEERDLRYLSGGNFFGREARAPPPLEPLASDFIDEDAALAQPNSTSSTPAPSLTLKLPAGGSGGRPSR